VGRAKVVRVPSLQAEGLGRWSCKLKKGSVCGHLFPESVRMQKVCGLCVGSAVVAQTSIQDVRQHSGHSA
jgi:hypothetical protein